MITKNKLSYYHLFIATFVSCLLFVMMFPFLPGKYDSLALPFSLIAQAAGFLGLLLVIPGTLMLIYPDHYASFLKLALNIITLIVALSAIIAYAISGFLLTFIIGLPWICLLLKFSFRKNISITAINNSVGWYLIMVPICLILFQILMMSPLTRISRDRSIKNASEIISGIENYNHKYGNYPMSLQAMYQDYQPNTIGVQQYYYMRHGSSYNISFEQPRFLLDKIGTREWVVYNPKDEHKVFSHSSWFLLLSPEALDRSQGWYETGYMGHTHWRNFLFD